LTWGRRKNVYFFQAACGFGELRPETIEVFENWDQFIGKTKASGKKLCRKRCWKDDTGTTSLYF
jgi:hypothetical protein